MGLYSGMIWSSINIRVNTVTCSNFEAVNDAWKSYVKRTCGAKVDAFMDANRSWAPDLDDVVGIHLLGQLGPKCPNGDRPFILDAQKDALLIANGGFYLEGRILSYIARHTNINLDDIQGSIARYVTRQSL